MHTTIILSILLLLVVIGFLSVWFLLVNNRWGAARLGDIPTPTGFERVPASEDSFSHFVRNLPLKGRKSWVRYYNGKLDKHLRLSSGVVNFRLLSKYEQCGNVPMHLIAEYLWQQGRYDEIVFHDNPGNELRYAGGDSHEELVKYLRHVCEWCNTSSLVAETRHRNLTEAAIGDNFVFTAGDREGQRLGHSVMVADVAKDHKGRLALMLLEGNTPARQIHLLRQRNPFRNPWIIVDEQTQKLPLSYCYFTADELRYYPQIG